MPLVFLEFQLVEHHLIPRALWSVLALLAYVATFAWIGRDWFPHIGESLAAKPSGVSDVRLITWVLDWVAYSLRFDWSSILDAPIYFPDRRWLTGTEHFGSSQLAFFPASLITGNPVAAANIAAMAVYPIGALAMFAYLEAMGLSRAVAFCGGFMLALGPGLVPPDLHVLQYLPLFFPLVGLTLLRLRERPGVVRAVIYAGALFLGLMSSFYTAMFVIIVAGVCVVVEVARPAPDRFRFLAYAAAASVVSVGLFVLASLPYLQRPEVELAIETSRGPIPTPLLQTALAVAWGSRTLVSLFALFGLASLYDRRMRPYTAGAIAIAVIGVLLAAGVFLFVAALPLPGPIADVSRIAARFFRITARGVVLAGFGLSILAAMSLELVRRRFPIAGLGLGLGFLVLFLGQVNSSMAAFQMIPVDAFGADQSSYRSIARVASSKGGGPLLELPRRTHRRGRDDSRAMMGQLIHRQPLITGHSGYPPKPWAPFNQWVGSLPDPTALENILCRTGLRWVIIRPADDWKNPAARGRMVQALTRSRSFVQIGAINDFVLIELDGRCPRPDDSDRPPNRRSATSLPDIPPPDSTR